MMLLWSHQSFHPATSGNSFHHGDHRGILRFLFPPSVFLELETGNNNTHEIGLQAELNQKDPVRISQSQKSSPLLHRVQKTPDLECSLLSCRLALYRGTCSGDSLNLGQTRLAWRPY